VPGFVSGTNAFLAFDSSIVPAGTSLSFYTTTSSGQQQTHGGIVSFAGNRPLVVAVPFSGGDGDAGHLTIVANSAGGVSSVFQLFVPGSSAP
ncbi:MAG TPA: hypothetical protein VN673_16400, partial [Clostridia bacterium]|nr:hypothetical protein [Clostridia bacterium]